MLLKMFPEKAVTDEWWEIVRESVRASIPPNVDGESSMIAIMNAILTGKLECWIALSRNDEQKVNGLLTTAIMKDEITDNKFILIFSLYASDRVGAHEWHDWLETIRKYARSNDCRKILAYTDSLQVVKLAKMLGGKAGQTILEFAV